MRSYVKLKHFVMKDDVKVMVHDQKYEENRAY